MTPNGRFLHKRLQELYDDAKDKAGHSLTIYEDVSKALDMLEDGDDEAETFADNICGRLRLQHNADSPEPDVTADIWEKEINRAAQRLQRHA